MSGLKELISESPVHERKMDFRTYPVDEDRVLVEGSLRDERFVQGYNWDGTTRIPGVVHHMHVRLLVGGMPPVILDAEAEMPGVPHEICPTTHDSVKKVIGVNITAGFSWAVKKRLGGIEGCVHLMHLIIAMGPAALHGYWNHKSREKRPVPKSIEDFPGLSVLINSCRLWAKDGPLISMIRERLAELNKKA